MIVLFSIFFWCFGFLWIAVSTVVIRLALLVWPFETVFRVVARPMLSVLIRLVTLGRLEIEYDDGYDPSIASVYCMNHTNVLDGLLAVSVIPAPFSGVMEAWQMNIPIYGRLMQWSGGIGIPANEHPRKTIRRLSAEARDRRGRGISILTFPEAHRTRTGKLRPFEYGVFRMAQDADYPIVTVSVRGMFAIKRKGSLRFSPGPIRVRVGTQRQIDATNKTELKLFAEDIRQDIASFVEA